MVTLPICLYLFIFVTILTLRWPSILGCYFSWKLRDYYIRGQVYQGQVLVQLEGKHQWVSSVQKEDYSVPRQKLDPIESDIAFV
jgi:hypothetical protein